MFFLNLYIYIFINKVELYVNSKYFYHQSENFFDHPITCEKFFVRKNAIKGFMTLCLKQINAISVLPVTIHFDLALFHCCYTGCSMVGKIIKITLI